MAVQASVPPAKTWLQSRPSAVGDPSWQNSSQHGKSTSFQILSSLHSFICPPHLCSVGKATSRETWRVWMVKWSWCKKKKEEKKRKQDKWPKWCQIWSLVASYTKTGIEMVMSWYDLNKVLVWYYNSTWNLPHPRSFPVLDTKRLNQTFLKPLPGVIG